jgi:hypothetical protein
MRSMRCDGVWTDEQGGERNASVEIAVDGGTARVTVSAIAQAGEELPTADRRIAYFLGRVQDRIRATEYASRPIVPDPKPKNSKVMRKRG